ncbi:DNA polymerase delta subunit 2 isoform X2 [Hydra vulgaris]|uniref:DNA polymerase delta subunit 2 isoform X2 n=1 Tax=Hydra vulgaris TaxID=6087 RepID=A0ABM4CCA3_HYDVU
MKIEKIERDTCSYKNVSDRFYFSKQRKFDLQYFQLYTVRLSAMRQRIIDVAKKKWGKDIKIMELSDIKEGEDCVVIGILFRKMELQPSILKEIAQEEGVIPLPPHEKYTSTDDILYLEAQQQRIVLIGDIDVSSSITGSVVAVRGHEDSSGKFVVVNFSYCGLPYLPCPNIDACLVKEDRYLLLTSGLGIGDLSENCLLLQIVIDLVSGKLGNEHDQSIFKKVVRLIIAGNSLSKTTQDKESEKVAKYLQKRIQAKSVEAVKQLDDILMQLGSTIPVDVMPGEFDPTNQFLPQQPLHKCMFPKSLGHSTVQSVTNPYQSMIGGLRVLGTSGQNIDNIYQYSCFDNRLDILESTLLRGHISPTSPDTLSCYPFYTEDPFIIDHCPHIYFVGNQPKFETRLIEGNDKQKVLLVCVPPLEKTFTLVMVNLQNLSCFPLTLNTSLESNF